MSHLVSRHTPCCGSGIRCLFDPWILDGKKIKIQIWDELPGSYFRELRNNFFGLKYLNSLIADADPAIFLTLDPGSGMEKVRIRDKHSGSATLVIYLRYRMMLPSVSKIIPVKILIFLFQVSVTVSPSSPVLPPLTAARFQLSGQLDFSTVTHDPDRQVVLTTAGRPLLTVPVEAGLAIKNPPKKNPLKKNHRKCFFWVF